MSAKARLALKLASVARTFAVDCPGKSVRLLRLAGRFFTEAGSTQEAAACAVTADKLGETIRQPRSRPGVRPALALPAMPAAPPWDGAPMIAPCPDCMNGLQVCRTCHGDAKVDGSYARERLQGAARL
jgi:hypothetical protein